MSQNQVAVFGMELHFTGGGSDKFYRLFVIENTVVSIYGRRGSDGQAVLLRFRSQDGAKAKAAALADEKEAKGYRVTREFTGFGFPVDELPRQVVQAFGQGAAPSGSVRLSGSDLLRVSRRFHSEASAGAAS